VNVDTAYQIVKYACAKNLQDGYISPDDFNLSMNTAQNQYLDFLLGEYQKYQPTRPFSPVAFADNQRVRTSMAALIYGTVLSIDSTGLANYPSDFEQVDAMWSVYNHYRIRFTQQDQLWSKYRSVIDPVETNPLYLLKQEGFQFYPTDLLQARMSYVRTPPPIHWGYDTDGNGLPVYNPALSQDPIWSETDIFQVIIRALKLVGVNLQFGVVMQYANDIKNVGQ